MSDLIVGWQVTPNLDPKYWLAGDAHSGGQSDSDLFKVSASHIAAHTAIIAQSGSGKSFFLGRIIEEIVSRTRARCVILDPNADFRRLSEVEDASLWTRSKYDVRTRAGKLCHELNRDDFASQWKQKRVSVRRATESAKAPEKPLKLSWPTVSADFLAESLGPVQKTELYNCHNFVKIVYDLLSLGRRRRNANRDYLKKAEALLNQAVANPSDFVSSIKEDLDIPDLLDLEAAEKPRLSLLFRLGLGLKKSSRERERVVDSIIERALNAARYVSEDTRRFYFGKLSGFRSAGVIATQVAPEGLVSEAATRIEVIDLPSISQIPTRLLAINACIEAEWEAARAAWDLALRNPPSEDMRVPTFIVIDEAHNVVPKDTRSQSEAALREQFRTIIAEGRKYGLFVILVSQRPDKLDRLVVSECENRAIMKLSSRSSLDATREMLALEDIPDNVLAKCLELPIGRALMVGNWTPDGPDFLYAAARRTVEGGRNLRSACWAVEPEQVKSEDEVISSTAREAVPGDAGATESSTVQAA